MSVGHLDVFFEECLFMSFAHFFTGLGAFGVLSLISSLWILVANPLPDMSFANIFSHSVGCLLVLPIVSFAVQKEAFYFDEVPVVHFAFVSLVSGDMLSKKLLRPRSKRFLPAFSSRILMASCLTLRSFIHFEFIFCVWCKKVVQVHSSACCCPVFPAPLAEETVFIPLDIVSHFVKG